MDSERDTSSGAARLLLQEALDALAASLWEPAVRSAGQALAIAPSTGFQIVALDVLAMAHHGVGNHEAASMAAIEALRLGSAESVPVVLEIAGRYVADGDAGRGIGLLEDAHLASPAITSIVAALATHSQQCGNYPGAIRWLEALDRIDPAGATGRRSSIDALRDTVARNAQTRAVIDRIGVRVGAICHQQVTSGPFAGQRLEHDHDFGWVATLIGCYEMELHPAIEHVIASIPRRVINVGCSGGYYAVGFARRIPSAHVIAFDIDATARESCMRAALENGVAGRIDIRAACSPSTLEELAGPGTVVFSDCEGYELQLLDPDVVPSLRETTIIVELHDIWIPNLAPRLLARFAQTHDISHIAMIPRDASRYPILKQAGLSDSEMSLAVSDFRAPGMTWAYMVPRLP